MRTILMFLLMWMSVQAIHAQEGTIQVIKDGKIDQLLELYSRHHNSFEEKPGYRIQILASTNREKAYDTESDFKMNYGQYKTYLTFKSPYFKLRVCDFTDKLEAYRFLQKVQDKYPGSFLVEENVKLW
ncbi:MAG: SPOR domain-containing protein [Bacteroidetes bacterium]|nr:SPOR domain-containing protein [Bacteroidota bacterium]